MFLRLLLPQKPDQAAVGELINGLVHVINPRFLHGDLLFLRDGRIGINPEHEGEKGINEILNIGNIHVRTELLQKHAHKVHGTPVGLLERIQQLLPAVCFHIVVVHGKKL